MSAALIAWGAALSVQDVRHRRISNAALLLVAIPAALLLLVTGAGPLHQGPLASLLGLLLATLLMLPGYALRQLGGGDFKLAMLIGFLLGPVATAVAMLVAALVWGGTAAVRRGLARQGRYALAPILVSGLGFVLLLPLLRSL